MRTIVYVDGFNLYYGALKRTPYKWLDLGALFDKLLPSPCAVVAIKYFTARVSSVPTNPNAPLRQDTYLRALQSQPTRVRIVEGKFNVKSKKLPLATPPHTLVDVMVAEEKGSDVSLAVEMVNDAWANNFDCACVVSNDADLDRALSIVKQQRRKRVILVTPGFPKRTPLASLKRWAHKTVQFDPSMLSACQFPSPIPGTTISKPSSW